jgi:nucleotide-binding universal stress UspA family protein
MSIASHEAPPAGRAAAIQRQRERSTTSLARRGPVVLATDGTSPSNAAVVIARSIADRLHRALHVVLVIEPAPIYSGPMEMAPIPSTIDPEFVAAREEAVQRYVSDALRSGAKWKLDSRYGTPGYEISAAARQADASVVVVGSAPHRRLGRTLSGVRAAQILRHVHCPVFSVAPELTALPHRAVAAIDFSPASFSAARTALQLLAETGTLTLVHVAPVFHLDHPVRDASGGLFGGDAPRLLESARETLLASAPAGVTIETRIVVGGAVEEVLVVANEIEADLIAVGTHGPNFVERLFVGSVAAELLHVAPCSVLASPPPDAAERVELELESSGTGGTSDASAWGQMLDVFTTRNTGRHVRVEVDDPAFGAQVQARGYVLFGAMFDAHDRRVEVMLSAPDAKRSHLTRTMSDVDWIAVTRNPTGRDVALQMRHGRGETLLVFED